MSRGKVAWTGVDYSVVCYSCFVFCFRKNSVPYAALKVTKCLQACTAKEKCQTKTGVGYDVTVIPAYFALVTPYMYCVCIMCVCLFSWRT